MEFNDLVDIVSALGDALGGGTKFLKGVREAKAEWQHWQSGAGAVPGSVGQWFGAAAQPKVGLPIAPEIRQVAATNGAAWVPDLTGGFGGVDVTGVWCPPGNVFDQCLFRQSGAYLNVAARVGAVMTFAGEGLLEPTSRTLAFLGRYANGAPAQVRAQLFPDGTIRGTLRVSNPWGQTMSNPLFLQRVG